MLTHEDIQNGVISGETRIIYDKSLSDITAIIDEVSHMLCDHSDSDIRVAGTKIHNAIHALAVGLVDNEVAYIKNLLKI